MSHKTQRSDTTPNTSVVEPKPFKKFSGTVYTLVYRPHEGFADYAVKTLVIKDGQVESEELSDPYAGFEALAKLELANTKMLEAMRSKYPPGFQHV